MWKLSLAARVLVFCLVGLGMGLAAGALVNSQGVESEPSFDRSTSVLDTGPVTGSLAPDFSLLGSDGVRYSLSELRGSPVLLNFWATWCAPCRVEMPAIQRQFEARREEGFTVLSINNDESGEAVQAFGEELGLTFPLLLDPGGEVQQLYRILAYPTSMFLDSQGMIQVVHFGVMTEGQIEGYLAQIGLRD